MIGTDLINNDKNTMGLFAGVGMTDMDEHDHIDQTFDGNMFQAGLYHQYRFGILRLAIHLTHRHYC